MRLSAGPSPPFVVPALLAGALRCLWPALLACLWLPVQAAETVLEEGGRFEVRSAFLEPIDGVYHLNATVDLDLSRAALEAVRGGVPLMVEAFIAVERQRSYLPDDDVASLVQRWQIRYHALSERFLVSNLNSGQQSSHSTLGLALAAVSQVRSLPVIDAALVEPGQRYEVSLRMVVTIEGGLPDTLRAMMFWMDWRRATDWYTWNLTP